jgi:hypothetical protein
VTIWLPGQVDPRKPENWLLRFDVEDDGGIGMASKCQAIWRNCTDKELVGAANPYLERHHGQYLFDLGRYRSYLLSPNALELGLRFRLADGAVRFKPATLQLGSEANLVPQLTLDSKTNTINWDARAIIKNDKTKSLNEVRFFVTKPGTTIDPSIELDLYQPSALEKATPDLRLPLADTNGAGSLPLSKLMEDVPQSGQGTISQVVMVVADKTGKTITLPSQPLTVGPGTSRRLY